ncbi:MAG: hypothetical protein Q9162_002295 [Coniocarpon cinnabarinum]
MAFRNSPVPAHQKRFSRDGFERLHPGDSTNNIPMNRVPSPARSYQSPSTTNEKQALYGPPAGGNGFRRSIKPGMSAQGAGKSSGARLDDEELITTRVGRFYQKFFGASVFLRYLVYVVPLGIVLAAPIVVCTFTAKNSKIGGVPTRWFFAWLLVAWCGLWISKTIAHCLPRIFQALAGVVSPGVRKYETVLRSLEIPISLVGWALISLATFRPIVSDLEGDPSSTPDPNNKGHLLGAPKWVDIVERILAALLICTIIYLIQRIFITMVSINYHRKQFNARIRDSKHNIFLLSLLYDASRAMFPAFCEEFAEEDAVISDCINITNSKKGGKSGSNTPLQFVQDMGKMGGKVGEKVTQAIGHVAHEITGQKDTFNPESAHGIVVQALEKNKSAEALARRIWLSFVVEGNDALYMDDVVEVLGAGRQPEAEACFHALDRDGNGDVSLDEMILTTVEFGRERHAISNSMQDVDQAIKVLDHLLFGIVLLACILVMVSFLVSSFYTTLATTGTALLSLSFVFSTTAQELLGSCIFLFVKHPYDIGQSSSVTFDLAPEANANSKRTGDRVEISDEALVVEHISLLFSIFRKINTNQLVQVPHIVLNTLWINNVTRSKAMREQLTINIDFATTFEDIQLLRSEMTKFVLDSANSRDFYPDLDIQVTAIGSMDKMELKVDVMHKSNWSNEAVRASRRSKFMCALVLALRRIPINPPGGAGASLGEAANPSYSVAISPSDADRNKADATAATEAARLVPKKDAQRDTAQSEMKAASALTERSNIAMDKSRDHADDLKDLHKQENPELEEVKSLLKKESTKGRRKSAHNPHRSLQSYPSTKSTRSVSQQPPKPVDKDKEVPPTPTVQVAAPTISSRDGSRARDRGEDSDVELSALPIMGQGQSPLSASPRGPPPAASPRSALPRER